MKLQNNQGRKATLIRLIGDGTTGMIRWDDTKKMYELSLKNFTIIKEANN